MPGQEVSETRLRCVLPFEAVPTEVRLLRRATVQQLDRWGALAASEEAELLVTELATNVFKHVGEGASATLILEWKGERIRMELHDKSPVLPTVRTARLDDEGGRGLHLLAGLAVDWGAILTAAGKAVWCEIPVLYGRRACRRFERAVEALENYQLGRGSVALDGSRTEAGLAQSAIELIADLLHWTTARGHDPDDILDHAQMHYEAEADAA
jgi:anti-sigma regulatory factor (Ser/Thr protein kinase)